MLNNGETAEVNGQIVNESQYVDAASEMKIVLSWDDQPLNLDSHLVGPSGGDSKVIPIQATNFFKKKGLIMWI